MLVKNMHFATLFIIAAFLLVACVQAFSQDNKALLNGISHAQAPKVSLLFKFDDPIVELIVDKSDTVFIETTSGDIFKCGNKAKPEKIVSAVNRDGFSFRSITLLPNGTLAYNDCIEKKDHIFLLDAQGAKTDLIALEDSVTCISATPSGSILVGLWKSEGNISLNMDPRYMNGADSIWGEILEIKNDKTQSSIYEGGLPLDICVGAGGESYASIWGQKGELKVKRKSYSVADPVHMFFIALSDDTRIISNPFVDPDRKEILISNALTALSLVQAVDKGLLIGYGISKEDKTGLYLLSSGKDPVAVPLGLGKIADITGIAVNKGRLYASYADGSVYQFSY